MENSKPQKEQMKIPRGEKKMTINTSQVTTSFKFVIKFGHFTDSYLLISARLHSRREDPLYGRQLNKI